MLEYLRIAVASATLLYTSYLDLKTREVDDKVWLVAGAFGLLVNLPDLIWKPADIIPYLLSIGATAGVAFSLYFVGLYGGADAKALTCLSAIHPFSRYGVQLHGIVGLTTFTNGMLLSALLPISLALYNSYRLVRGEEIFEGFESEPGYRKFFALFIGTRVMRSSGKRFWSPVEKRAGGVKRFTFNITIDDMDEAFEDDMWITPGIPLLVFFTAGYLLSLVFGDFMGQIFHFFTRLPG
ncbi:hypothetical protein HRbin01_00347 [archaeon HR01]|nr:hypothetical protein HRbin01_00347 [archaeon HR01]